MPWVKCGSQRIYYTGVIEGGIGGLVGPGAAPSAWPGLAMAAGSGVESGAHDYAVTFTTAAGESIVGSRTSITVGTIPVPTTAPAGTLSSGGSVNAGDHDYEYTFVTATGETSPSPASASITTGGAAASPPSSAPTAGTPTTGGSVTPGDHYYATTFVNAAGETAAGPNSGSVTTRLVAQPSGAIVAAKDVGGNLSAGDYRWKATFVNAAGETAEGSSGSNTLTMDDVSAPSAPSGSVVAGTAGSLGVGTYAYKATYVNAAGETTPSSASSGVAIANVSVPPASFSVAGTTGGSIPSGTQHSWYVTYTTAAGETTRSGSVTITLGGSDTAANLTNIPTSSDGRVTGRKIYREDVGDGGNAYYVGTLNDNTTTTFTDTLAGGSRGAVSPATNTSGSGRVTVTIPTSGDGSVTARKIYRTVAGGSTYKLLATISDNTTTTYNDNTADGSLGANAPSSNTASYRKANLTSIPTSADATVTARKLYRTVAGGSTFKLVTTINNNTATTYTDNIADGSLGADAPSSNTATVQTVPITSIQTGPAGTTARKLYRTEAGGSTLKLLTTISDNTTTTFSDTVADGSLGATAPSGATLNTVNLTGIAVGNAAVTSRKLYRRFNATGTYKLVTTLADNTTTTYTDTTANASLGAAAPDTNTATANRVSLTAIPLGGATVTGRKVYRTVAGGSTLKLLTTLADNTTTTYTDSTADASLGATAPGSDTSGLAQPEGQLAAGSTSVIVANSAAFDSTGGWAVVGNGELVIRYTGKTASTLTGVPATGVGSLSSAIAYNQTITQAPALVGIPASGPGSIQYAIKRGDPVNVFEQVDDVAAQGVLAVLLSTPTRTHSGIIEAPLLQDRRLSRTEAAARGRARLTEIKDPLVTIRYQTRDMTTRSGLDVTIALDPPTNISGTFKIQRVTLSRFGDGTTRPIRTVEASSRRLSFEAILRLIKGA